ncbi:MAG: hypothetical protein LWW85_01695 [Marinilabiliales bacterium]|nr:hypothetical protein [Marinilabiliales bacterium]
MLVEESEIRKVHGITNEQIQRILTFLQGAVYCWCKNRRGEWFAARDLLGGDNFYWEGTPMFALYEKSKDIEQAGRDAGWLLKRMLHDDKRTYESSTDGRVKQYRWNGQEDNG